MSTGRCVVFGGGGFIGSAVVERLLSDRQAVRVFERHGVRPFRKFMPHEVVEWVSGDFQCPDGVRNALDGIGTVFHVVSATLPEDSNRNPIFDIHSNLQATIQLLDAMVAMGVRKIVFVSSGGTVYGEPEYLPMDEQHPTNPIVSYGITKLAIEKYLLLYERLHGIRPVILRVANPYGERQRAGVAQGAVGVFLRHAIQGETVEIWGDGSAQRDFLHVMDVAEALVLAASYDGRQRVFNVGSGTGTSLNRLLEMIEGTLCVSVRRVYRQSRSFDVPVSVLCNRLAKTELGWEPRISLGLGLSRTADWIRNRRQA